MPVNEKRGGKGETGDLDDLRQVGVSLPSESFHSDCHPPPLLSLRFLILI